MNEDTHMHASPTQVAAALQAAHSMMVVTGSVGCTHIEEDPQFILSARVDRKGQHHVRARQMVAAGDGLAAKLRREATYTVRTSGTGRPGYVSLWTRNDEGALKAHDEHRDSRIVQHYARLGLLTDPQNLLTAPDSSD